MLTGFLDGTVIHEVNNNNRRRKITQQKYFASKVNTMTWSICSGTADQLSKKVAYSLWCFYRARVDLKKLEGSTDEERLENLNS